MSTTTTAETNAALAATNIAIVRELIAAINAWDFDTLNRLCHPTDFLFTIPFVPEGFPTEVVGRDAWVGFVRDWSGYLDGGENLDDLHIDALTSSPGEIITRYTSDMLLKTGYRYQNRYVGRFLVEDGYVTRFDEYLDSIPLLLAGGGQVVAPPNQVL